MASTTQRNKARVAALRLPKLAQTADAVGYERSLERFIDDLEDTVDDLTWDLADAQSDLANLNEKRQWVVVVCVAYAVFTLTTWLFGISW